MDRIAVIKKSLTAFVCGIFGLVPIIVLFAFSQPDLYRTKLWTVGFNYGFNSNPLIGLYAAANYQPAPVTPFVWSQMYELQPKRASFSTSPRDSG